jgi:HAD superfamily hydrolase (TIGR01450 family)
MTHGITSRVTRLSFTALAEQYEAVLFDAYGVLVNAGGALHGAAEALTWLTARGQRFLIVTNDASRSPLRAATRFARLGMPVREEHVVSSGMLIGPALVEHGLERGRVVVVGTGDSAQYARDVGATVIEPQHGDVADAIVIADEGGFELLDVMDRVLSMILAGCDAGRPPRLLLANPDLVYPSGDGRFGFTAGSLARMVDGALALLLGDAAPTFEVLGKPAARHFEAALARVGTRDAVMLGDTLHTDVAGAQGVGIASAIVLTGVTTRAQVLGAGVHAPTYLLESLQL